MVRKKGQASRDFCCAIECDDIEWLREIIESGFDPRQILGDGESGLFLAAWLGSEKCLNELLDAGCKADCVTHNGKF